jgi:hypothetical protein
MLLAMAMGKAESKAREARVNFILIVGCLFLDFGCIFFMRPSK